MEGRQGVEPTGAHLLPQIEHIRRVDVTVEFRRAVSEVAEQDWQTLYRKVGEHRVDTGQQWAEVNFVPNWIGHSKNSPAGSPAYC